MLGARVAVALGSAPFVLYRHAEPESAQILEMISVH